jgi:hypothetical protein
MKILYIIFFFFFFLHGAAAHIGPSSSHMALQPISVLGLPLYEVP